LDITWFIVGAAVVLVVIVLLVSTFRKARAVSLTENTDEESERIPSTPLAEMPTAPKTSSDNEQAAPFVEQIEDILNENLETDEYLGQYKVDLGAARDGGIEIWVNGEMYTDIRALPDERLIQAIQEAVDQWNKG
jgi:cytoskeletal protein RodZ